MQIPRIRAVIFDLDGTLLDTFPAIVRAFNAATAPILGHQTSPDEVIKRFGVPDVPLIQKALPDATVAEQNAAIERYFEAYQKAHDEIRPFDGIENLLQTIEKIGWPMGIMTGKGRRALEITLEEVGWSGRFGATITGDDVEEQKPHPEGVVEVARLLGVAPQNCIYVGDSPADIETAHRAQMLAVFAAWHAYYRDQMPDGAPDFSPRAPADLENWLQKRADSAQN